MSEYTCRYGRSRRKTPVSGYNELLGLPNREGPDDGTIILAATLEDWGGEPLCADCNVGHLRWAEGGYVPFHRICDVCGSHWDLHPIGAGAIKATPDILDQISTRLAEKCSVCRDWCETCEYEGREHCGVHKDHTHDFHAEYVQFKDHVGFIPLDTNEAIGESGKTWGDFLALITPEMWAAAAQLERVQRMANMISVGGAWARRARFY